MDNEFKKSSYRQRHSLRYQRTLNFIQQHLTTPARILDLGPVNPLATLMSALGFYVENTDFIDLDLDFSTVDSASFDVLTAFQIFEHMVNPFSILESAKCDKLFASVPLNMWFAKAYWNDEDPFDRHYHEFEPKQFDMLLVKAGWKIIDSEKWITKSDKFGLRPLLRRFTPRHYIVYCERSKEL